MRASQTLEWLPVSRIAFLHLKLGYIKCVSPSKTVQCPCFLENNSLERDFWARKECVCSCSSNLQGILFLVIMRTWKANKKIQRFWWQAGKGRRRGFQMPWMESCELDAKSILLGEPGSKWDANFEGTSFRRGAKTCCPPYRGHRKNAMILEEQWQAMSSWTHNFVFQDHSKYSVRVS